MKKSLPYFIILSIIFIITIVVVLLTSIPFANAFLNHTRSLVITFCVFLAIDIFRWIAEGDVAPSKSQELGWTTGIIMFMVYFLWDSWLSYSLWQVCIVVTVCVVLGIGLLVRLFSKWDVDCVRWSTWALCCLVVTTSIVASILIWNPMTLMEAERLTIASEGDSSFIFRYVDPSKSRKIPLGNYIFYQKQLDGSWGSYGTGRAVVYLGENQELWRSPRPRE